MKKIEAIIFDMDGTLYSFDKGPESNFVSSRFGQTIVRNCIAFFETRFTLSTEQASTLFQELSTRYHGEVSLAVEKEFGISRQEYFQSTWDLPVESFITPDPELKATLVELSVRAGVLTAAPRVWAEKVLQYLDLRQLFGTALFTGDPDLRKPSPLAFLQLAELWQLAPEQIISIGDQELTDILPAQTLGMRTLRIATDAKTQADYVAPTVRAAIQLLNEKGLI